MGKSLVGLAGYGTLWAGCRGGSEVGQEEVSQGAKGPVTLEFSFVALPQAARLCLSVCQNGHSLCQWPNCQLEGNSWGRLWGSESRYSQA